MVPLGLFPLNLHILVLRIISFDPTDPADQESYPPYEPAPKDKLDALKGQLKLNGKGQILAIAQDAVTANVLTLCWLDFPMLREQLEDCDFAGLSLGDSEPVSFGDGVKIVDVRLDCDGDCLLMTLLPPTARQDGEGAGEGERGEEPDENIEVLPSSYLQYLAEFGLTSGTMPETLPLMHAAARDKAPASWRRAPIQRLLGRLHFDQDGLLPAIAQDSDSGDVLMQAWTSRESLEQLPKANSVCYWSRSRQEIWIKGEQSGNRQDLLELRAADDNASLLLYVRQHGDACHKKQRSCFFRRLGPQGWEECTGKLKLPSLDGFFT